VNWVSALTRNISRIKIKEINFKNLETFKITGNDTLFEGPVANKNLIPLVYYAELDLKRHETISRM
jgi:hypothetical protein